MTHFSRTAASLAGVMLFALALSPSVARAQAKPEATAAPAPEKAGELKAIVRGLYFEGGVGGGYMVVPGPIKEDSNYPALCGNPAKADESCPDSLGAGTMVRAGLGYDLTNFLSLQLVGGLALVSSRRTDKVRDLGLLFGGALLRAAVSLDERLDLVVSGGAGYVKADNSVDAAQTGAAALGGLGLEYFVHVRHFSIGVDVSVLAPLSPQRVFVGLSPRLKYAF